MRRGTRILTTVHVGGHHPDQGRRSLPGPGFAIPVPSPPAAPGMDWRRGLPVTINSQKRCPPVFGAGAGAWGGAGEFGAGASSFLFGDFGWAFAYCTLTGSGCADPRPLVPAEPALVASARLPSDRCRPATKEALPGTWRKEAAFFPPPLPSCTPGRARV